MARGDAVHGIGVIRDLNRPIRQLLPKSYRARSAAQRRLRQFWDSRGQLLRRPQPGPPQPLARRRVDRRRNLAAAGVEDGEAAPLTGDLTEPARQRVQRAHPTQWQAAAQRQPPRSGDAHAQAGKGPGPDPDGEPTDLAPTTSRLRRPLDLCQQRRRVLRSPLLGEAEQRFMEDLAAVRRGDSGVGGRGIEADYGQWLGTKKLKTPTRLPCTNQLTWCLPGMLEVILLT